MDACELLHVNCSMHTSEKLLYLNQVYTDHPIVSEKLSFWHHA